MDTHSAAATPTHTTNTPTPTPTPICVSTELIVVDQIYFRFRLANGWRQGAHVATAQPKLRELIARFLTFTPLHSSFGQVSPHGGCRTPIVSSPSTSTSPAQTSRIVHRTATYGGRAVDGDGLGCPPGCGGDLKSLVKARVAALGSCARDVRLRRTFRGVNSAWRLCPRRVCPNAECDLASCGMSWRANASSERDGIKG